MFNRLSFFVVFKALLVVGVFGLSVPGAYTLALTPKTTNSEEETDSHSPTIEIVGVKHHARRLRQASFVRAVPRTFDRLGDTPCLQLNQSSSHTVDALGLRDRAFRLRRTPFEDASV